MSMENIPNVIASCRVLHNIFEIHGDVFDDDWLNDVEEVTSDQQNNSPTANSESGSEVRDKISGIFCS